MIIARQLGTRRTCAAWLCGALLLACATSRAGQGPDQESLCVILTADGSVIKGLVAHGPNWTLATANAAQTLDPQNIASITLGERIDPNVENEAQVAVGDLQSDKFEVREKAEAKLRSLGRSAAKPLRQALSSTDTEVVRRVRALLVEVGAGEADTQMLDRVKLRDGTMMQGELNITDIMVRTGWGRFRFPLEAVERIVFLDAQEAKKSGNAELKFAAADAKEVVVAPPPVGRIDAAAAQRWDPAEDSRNDPAMLEGWLAEAQRNALTMDKIPDAKAAKDAPKKLIASKPGDRLEDVYAERGVQLRATENGATVEVSPVQIQSFSGGMSATTKKSDLEVRFTAPKTEGATLLEETAGVMYAGAIIRSDGPGTIGLAAYDAAGRLIVQVLNQRGAPANAGGMQRDEFLGVRSKTPISRLRFFRLGSMKTNNSNVIIDDLIHDRVALVGLRAELSRVSLISGEKLAGKAVETDVIDSVALKAEFLGPQAEPVKFKLDLLSRYEPARAVAVEQNPETDDEDEAKPKKRRRFGAPHGILLQSGETFRARLLSLDDKNVVFGFSGGAMIKLPRETVRKVELIPPKVGEGEATPPTMVEPNEKPGLAFRTKPVRNDPAAPQIEEKKNPKYNPAQGLPSMDNVEIVSLDPESRELTVKDENGEMTMGVGGIRALIFPPNPNAVAAAKKRTWTLTLREGSRFDADVLRITPTDITMEMAGGMVIMPTESIEAVERK